MRNNHRGHQGAMMCVCCSAVIGAIFTIVGVAFLLAPNNREPNIARYNAAGNDYSNGAYKEMSKLTVQLQPASGGQIAMSGGATQFPPSGNQQNVKRFDSYFFVENTAAAADLTASSFTFTKSSVSAGSISNVPLLLTNPATSTTSEALICQASDCSTGGSSSCSCTANQMQSRCTTSLSGTYSQPTSTPPPCQQGRSCGTCSYPSYLSSVCIPIISSGTTVTLSPTKSSCFYPFTSSVAVYGRSNVAPTVMIMDETDPFIALGQITLGRMNFGPTVVEQNTAGLAFTVVGGALGLGFIFGLMTLWRVEATATAALVYTSTTSV